MGNDNIRTNSRRFSETALKHLLKPDRYSHNEEFRRRRSNPKICVVAPEKEVCSRLIRCCMMRSMTMKTLMRKLLLLGKSSRDRREHPSRMIKPKMLKTKIFIYIFSLFLSYTYMRLSHSNINIRLRLLAYVLHPERDIKEHYIYIFRRTTKVRKMYICELAAAAEINAKQIYLCT